jgi:hypothetical protein
MSALRHCPADGEHQYLGPNLAVEHRYLDSILQLAVPVHVGNEWQATVTPSTEIQLDRYGDSINYCDCFRLQRSGP